MTLIFWSGCGVIWFHMNDLVFVMCGTEVKHEWWSVMSVNQSGALVNVVNNHGNTGLHEAVRGGHVQLVELLLHRGALVHIRNKRQRTVLDCAHDTGGKVCVRSVFMVNPALLYTHIWNVSVRDVTIKNTLNLVVLGWWFDTHFIFQIFDINHLMLFPLI